MDIASRRPALLLGSALALAFVLPACSGIQVTTARHAPTGPQSVERYAWAVSALPQVGADGRELYERVRSAVEAGLAERGVQPAGDGPPQALLRLRTGIALKSRGIDPTYAAFYTMERYEEGRLTLELLDPATHAPVWSGKAASELRVVSKGYGSLELRWVDTHEPRHWPVEAMIEELLARLPTAAAQAAPESVTAGEPAR